MNQLFLITSYTATLISILVFILLFVKRKAGGRARAILCILMFGSIVLFFRQFLNIYFRGHIDFVLSIPVILFSVFIHFCRILYPIEVIRPDWLNLRRTFLLFIPVFLFLILFMLLLRSGLNVDLSRSIFEQMDEQGDLGILFMGIIYLLYLSPILYVLYFYLKSEHAGVNNKWLMKLFSSLLACIVSYMILLASRYSFFFIHYIVMISLTSYVAYLELYVRKPEDKLA